MLDFQYGLVFWKIKCKYLDNITTLKTTILTH